MKSALVYLSVTRLKNLLRSLVTKPASLIYLVFMAAMLGIVAFSGNVQAADTEAFRPITELFAIVMAFFTAMFMLIFLTALNAGASVFTMPDVTLVFPSPLKPQRVLLYGMVRQLGTSILLGLFILFQYSWMHGAYGVGYPVLIGIILGYGITIFLANLTAMTCFCYFSSKEHIKRIITFGTYGLVLLLLVPILLQAYPSIQGKDYGAALQSAADYFNLPAVRAFPVSGWIAGILAAAFQGEYLSALPYLGALALFVAALVTLLLKNKNNYYEDVIKATEAAQSAITAKKEGVVGEVVGKNVRVGKTGLEKGSGANSIYFKHLKENQRSGILGISNLSLLFDICILLAALFMRDLGILSVFLVATYLQLFSASLGRFSRELSKPYIYLIPEPPLKKLFFSTLETLRSDALEALLIFAVVAFIMGVSPAEAVLCICARISFSLLLTAVNIALSRLFGGILSKTFTMMLYFLMALLMAVPGIAAAILLFIFCTPYLTTAAAAFIGLAVLNIPVSMLVMYLCRNMLQYAELNNT